MSVWAKFAEISSRENFYLYSMFQGGGGGGRGGGAPIMEVTRM